MLRIKVIGSRSLIDDSTYVYRNEYEFVYDAACREYDWFGHGINALEKTNQITRPALWIKEFWK